MGKLSSGTIIFLASLALVPGCKSSSNKATTNNPQAKAVPTKAVNSKESHSKQPYWILDSQLKGHLGVVGSAGKQDFGGKQAQMRVAMVKARAELAKIYQTHIESTTHITQTDRGSSMDVATRASSNQGLQLEHAIVLEDWTDPDTGELFIWLVLPVK